jgi:hypothetical protein
MKKKLATALRLARKIAVTPAQAARPNRPKPVATRSMPSRRWIQPQADVSTSNE